MEYSTTHPIYDWVEYIEGERNKERKFLKVNAYNYIHTLFVASE